MDKNEFIKKILGCPLFRGLDGEEMAKILAFAKFKAYPPNEIILSENDETDVFFVVETGLLEAKIDSKTRKSGILIRNIKAGELCGEMALLGIEKRTASIKTIQPSRIVVWNAVDVLDYFRKNRGVGYLVMQNLAVILGERIRDMNLLLRHFADTIGPPASKFI